MSAERLAFGGLSPRSLACCTLVAAITFTWPVVGTIALRNLLLGGLLLLLLSDRAVHARSGAVLRDLAVPAGLLLALTGWIVVHNATLSQYPEYSMDELRGQWLKPLLIFGVGMLLAARCRTEPGLVAALLATMKWALVLQVVVVISDLFYLWLRDISLPLGVVRLTGTRTSVSYSVLLLLSIIASGWLRRSPSALAGLGSTRLMADTSIVATALICLMLIGSRYGIGLSLGQLTLVAAVFARRQARGGRVRRAMLLMAMTAIAIVAVLYGTVRFDSRWTRTVESAQLVFAPGHEHDWRLFSDVNPPRFDDGTPVESSAFLRVARFRAGLDLIAERPLGWGFGRSAMERIVMLRHKTGQIASDSGLVDWTLAIGIPGTVLWLAFMGVLLRMGWAGRHEPASIAPLLLFMVVAIFMIRFMVDINTRDHMFETFLFLCGLLGGAVPRRPPEAAGR